MSSEQAAEQKFIVGPNSSITGKYRLLVPGTVVTAADFDGLSGGVTGGQQTLDEFVSRGLILVVPETASP